MINTITRTAILSQSGTYTAASQLQSNSAHTQSNRNNAQSDKATSQGARNAMLLREKLRGLSNDTNNSVSSPKSIIDSTLEYGSSIRSQRTKSQDTASQLKKLKYQFKDISSKILRSKTSSSAKQVVGQAKREVLRLRRQKQSGKYDAEEMDAAITHAKAMERVARKKVKHLEEEEMAKAAMSLNQRLESEEKAADGLADFSTEDMKSTDEDSGSKGISYTEAADCTSAASYIDDTDYISAASYIEDENYISDTSYKETSDPEPFEEFSEAILADFSENMSSLADEMGNIMSEMQEVMSEVMSQMGLEELSESLLASSGKMDENDLHDMIIKHRNKEMKDIVKADAKYLKAVFEQMNKGGGTGGMPSGEENNTTLTASDFSSVVPTIPESNSSMMIDVSI